MLLGYNTNGLAHHDLLDAVRLLADVGYRSVAISIDHHALPPGRDWTARQLAELRRLLGDAGMRSVIETGARFLLDPRAKHQPTLLSADPAGRRRRVEFYQHAVRMAAELGSDCVSIWSGALGDCPDLRAAEMGLSPSAQDEAMARLADGLAEVAEFAASHGVVIGFEPEPGMFIDSMQKYEQLLARFDAPSLRLTLDVGHLHCQGETPLDAQIRRWAPRLVNVHLEDMRRGRHEHLMFGEGEIDFPPVLNALAECVYQGGVHVELSRHSHEGPQAARRAYEFLSRVSEGFD